MHNSSPSIFTKLSNIVAVFLPIGRHGLFVLLILASCNSGDEIEGNGEIPEAKQNIVQDSALSAPAVKQQFELITNYVDTIGWGYDIYVDGTMYIHQPHIPAVPGNKGFKTEEDAQKTAGLVIYKLSIGISPPSITPDELDSLGVLK